MGRDLSQNIRDRTFHFGCDVSRLVISFPADPRLWRVLDQLIRSGTSVGANLEEAKAASSKREFLKYLQIGLRECREAVYWLRICAHIRAGSQQQQLDRLRDEGEQIARILGAIVVNTRRRLLAEHPRRREGKPPPP